MLRFLIILITCLLPVIASAEVIAPTLNSGDVAWLLTSAAFVMLMTPGLALFYGSMIGSKYTGQMMFYNFLSIPVVSILWVIIGYTLAFGGGNNFIGNFDYLMFKNMVDKLRDGTNIPHILFAMFQMKFAIIAPAIMSGAFGHKISTKAWVLIMVLWSLLVYCPIAHWCWSSNGFLAQKGVLDFAGGYVVHISSGFSALVIATMLSRSKKLATSESSEINYDPQMLIIGTTLLWFGWFGFNSGSALASNQLASWAFATTFIGSAVCMASWCLFEYFTTKKVTIIGACCGSVCGLVAITPASGYVNVEASIIIGIVTAVVAMVAQKVIKKMCKIDDTLDVFSCHGIAGLIGSIATGIFATSTINPAVTKQGAIYGSNELLLVNFEAALIVAVYSVVCTLIIYYFVRCFGRIEIE